MTEDKVQMCDACDEHPATQRILYEQFCDECYPRKKALDDAERRASGRQIDYAELALGVEERDAELARLRAELEQAKASKPFDARDELQQLRTSNHYMAEELTRLRAEHAIEFRDLSEARADVARFEAALDVANRELAEARRERDFAQEGEENLRHLKKMWEQECGYYVGLWREKSHECSRHRSTIRALVVAFRIVWYCVINEYPRAKDTIKRLIAERGQAGKE